MFQKILIANRGEIALRIQRACRELGIPTVAVHSTADSEAMHVRLADESVCIGPPPAKDSYLNIPAILSAAAITGADALHPGYGFLSENANFAEMVEAHGVAFIGPGPKHIRMMGDKIAAKAAMASLGVPLVPGSDGAVADVLPRRARGCRADRLSGADQGGRGRRRARHAGGARPRGPGGGVQPGSGRGARGVRQRCGVSGEIPGSAAPYRASQILADAHLGNVVHFGERDCSLQRRHQKLLEEAGSPALTPLARDALGLVATQALAKIGYRNAGTLEFLYQDEQFAFIEMNTRLQVEHPVTEMVCGVDLVREQIRIAFGAELGYGQSDIHFTGHAIECRINAEDPVTFMPTPGRVTAFHAPGGLGVRVDSALYAGCVVPPYYDSMVAKLIVHAPTRADAIGRLRRALSEFAISGIQTTIPLHQRIVEDPFVPGG